MDAKVKALLGAPEASVVQFIMDLVSKVGWLVVGNKLVVGSWSGVHPALSQSLTDPSHYMRIHVRVHVQARGPAEATQELEPLLDSDTETFVIKLYRTVIFETERAAAGL